MKSFFLFILFLIAVKACSKDEVDFISNPKTGGKYQRPEIINEKGKTNEDILKVMIKSGKEKLEFRIDDDCPEPFIQTAYRGTETTISCKNPEESRSGVKVFCKENYLTCENVQLQTSSQRPDGTFIVTETSSSFDVSIRNVSSTHAGTYWCGAKHHQHAHLKKIKLEVKDITNFIKSAAVGQNVTYWCKYNKDYSNYERFVCKGRDPNTCEHLVSSTKMYMERFSMNENKENQNITITVREVKAADTGMYWCGVERTGRSPKFFHRMFMDVVSPATSTVAPESHGGVGLVNSLVIGAVAVTLLLTAFIFTFKRCTRTKNIRSRESEQHPKEGCVYEEIQEHKEGTANSATANFPADYSASLHYSTINFQRIPVDHGDGETLVLKPSSSSCLYSALNCSQNTSPMTVEESSSPADESPK